MASASLCQDERFQGRRDESDSIRKPGDGQAASENMFDDSSGDQHDTGVTTSPQQEEEGKIVKEDEFRLTVEQSCGDSSVEERMCANSTEVEQPRGHSAVKERMCASNTAVQRNMEAAYPEVDVLKCGHKLSKMRYSARTQLSDSLDARGIDKLIHQVSGEDFIDIWRECNGGNQPAFGLIYLLAQSKLVTLEKFQNRASEEEPERSKRLVEIIKTYLRENPEKKKVILETRLDRLPFTLLLQITSEISPNPYPIEKQTRPLWKSIGCAFDFEISILDSLDIPAVRANLRESMTMKFIEIMNQRYPSRKVAWLAKGLKDIQRNDLLCDRKVFGQCIDHGCVKLPPELR